MMHGLQNVKKKGQLHFTIPLTSSTHHQFREFGPSVLQDNLHHTYTSTNMLHSSSKI